MLLLKQTVPDSVLLDRPMNELAEVLQKQSAHWFHVSPEAVSQTESGIEWIQSLTSKSCAKPATPNEGNSVYAPAENPSALAFQKGINCGFALPYSDDLGASYSFAIRFTAPDSNARTLLTLNPQDVDNYLFLNQADGMVIFKDQKTTVEIETHKNMAPDQVCLLVGGQSGGALFLRVDTGPILCSPGSADLQMKPPGHLFIGCRNNRGGLKKTLGSFAMRDVIFWPDRNILETQHSETLNALDEYCMWET